jgi:hypothetical protein
MKTNPITPPRELVREWYGSEDCPDGANALANYLCTQAAQWGADQELEACCEWLEQQVPARDWLAMQLRAARTASPSLKEQALKELDDWTLERHGLGGKCFICDGLSVATIPPRTGGPR